MSRRKEAAGFSSPPRFPRLIGQDFNKLIFPAYTLSPRVFRMAVAQCALTDESRVGRDDPFQALQRALPLTPTPQEDALFPYVLPPSPLRWKVRSPFTLPLFSECCVTSTNRNIELSPLQRFAPAKWFDHGLLSILFLMNLASSPASESFFCNFLV